MNNNNNNNVNDNSTNYDEKQNNRSLAWLESLKLYFSF